MKKFINLLVLPVLISSGLYSAQLIEELNVTKVLAIEAGKAILELRDSKVDLHIVEKIGEHPSKSNTPVTAADLKANDIIVNGLQKAFPSYAILSEELFEEHSMNQWWESEYVWFIDPLGGTQDFIQGGTDFGVYIGLSKDGVPVLGVIYFPCKDTLYWATRGNGAYKQIGAGPAKKLVKHQYEEGIIPVKGASLSSTKAIYDHLFANVSKQENEKRFTYFGSFGLRGCSIAEGPYNLNLFDGKKGGLWDCLSIDVILKEVGGFVSDWNGNPIDYRRQDASLKNGVILAGDKKVHQKAISAIASYRENTVNFYAYSDDIVDDFDNECILCTPSEKYAATIAFTNHWKITYWKNQAYLGRLLIISKRHFGSYEEMNEEEAKEYHHILQQLLPVLKETFNATHFNVAYLMNQAYRHENQKNGNPNPHFHWHVIPRYDGKRTFEGIEFEDPEFGNSFEFDRKQYPTGEFQRKAIEILRKRLNVIFLTDSTLSEES